MNHREKSEMMRNLADAKDKAYRQGRADGIKECKLLADRICINLQHRNYTVNSKEFAHQLQGQMNIGDFPGVMP